MQAITRFFVHGIDVEVNFAVWANVFDPAAHVLAAFEGLCAFCFVYHAELFVIDDGFVADDGFSGDH